MAMVMEGFTNFLMLNNGDQMRLQNLDEARTIMDVMSKDIRTAGAVTAGTSPFVYAADNEVTFYGNISISNGPSKFHLYVDASNPSAPILIAEVYAPVVPLTNPPSFSAPTTRYVGYYIVNGVGQPLFTYYDGANPPQVLTTPMSGTNASLLAIRSVSINLMIRQSNNQAVPATTLVNQVGLPNLFYTIPPSPTP
jgi:hypothetical protein